MFTPIVNAIKCQTWLILCTTCWIQQNVSSSLGKIFNNICKVLFGPFRKYYGLRTSELPLAKFQRLKKQDFGIPLFTEKFFYLPIIHFPNCDKLFAVISSKYKKNSDF